MDDEYQDPRIGHMVLNMNRWRVNCHNEPQPPTGLTTRKVARGYATIPARIASKRALQRRGLGQR